MWYFLKNCLKGHLRNFQGRSMTFGPAVPNVEVSDYRRVLENTKPGRPMLGDADDWDGLIKSQSIIVAIDCPRHVQVRGKSSRGEGLFSIAPGGIPESKFSCIFRGNKFITVFWFEPYILRILYRTAQTVASRERNFSDAD